MKKVLVTGATGFVGKAIVDELLKRGHELYTCAKSQSADLPNYFSVDITSSESVRSLFRNLPRDLDVVVHSAGLAHQFRAVKDPSIFNDVNVEGTAKILMSACAGSQKKFILISSISVYGDGKPNPTAESFSCVPRGDYAESKYRAEVKAKEIVKQTRGIDLIVLRLATVYGPGDVGNVLRLIKLIDSGRFFWTGKADNSKSLIFSEDAARAVRFAVESEGHHNQAYNVTDAPHTMREIVETIALKLSKKVSGVSIPASAIQMMLKPLGVLPLVGSRARGLADTLKKWRSDDVLSGEKIERELGFRAETSLADGIKREVDWYLHKK